MNSDREGELVETVDGFAELITEMLNHCGPLSVWQKRKVRESVAAWWDARRELVEE